MPLAPGLYPLRLASDGGVRLLGTVRVRPVVLMAGGDFTPGASRSRYDANASATYKVDIATKLGLDVFCEDDDVIALALAHAGIPVWLFDRPWNRDIAHARVIRVPGWEAVEALALR